MAMDRLTAVGGAYTPLLEEAMVSLATDNAIFKNAPEGTQLILLTVRAFPITLRLNKGEVAAATAAANGHDYAVNSTTVPYEFTMSRAEALKVRAIQNGGASTGWVTYLKLA
jgi:hypothetical protein